MSGTGLPVVVGVSSPSLSHTMALVDDSRIASSTPQSRGPYPAGSPSGGFDDGGYPPPRPRSTQDAPSARTPVMPDDDVNQSALSPDVAPASVPASSEKSPSVEPASEASISVVDTVGEEWRQARLSLFSPRELSLSSLSPGARLWGWLGPLLVAIVAGVARFVRLGTPRPWFLTKRITSRAHSPCGCSGWSETGPKRLMSRGTRACGTCSYRTRIMWCTHR